MWDWISALTVCRVHRRVLLASCGQHIYRKNKRRIRSSRPTFSLINYNTWKKIIVIFTINKSNYLLNISIIYLLNSVDFQLLSVTYCICLHLCIYTISHSKADTTVLLLRLRFLQLQHKNAWYMNLICTELQIKLSHWLTLVLCIKW